MIPKFFDGKLLPAGKMMDPNIKDPQKTGDNLSNRRDLEFRGIPSGKLT